MIKARAWPVRAMYMLIAAALAIGLLLTAAPAQKVSSANDSDVDAEWTRVDTPTMDGWVLAPESVIVDYHTASAGEVAYAVVMAYDEDCSDSSFTDQDFRLLKSEDYCATWTDLTDALEDLMDVDGGDYIQAILRVATDWEDPEFVAVALVWFDQSANGGSGASFLHVFFSTDGGTTFIDAKEVEDGSVYQNMVSDLVVSPEAGGKRDIVIGGAATSGAGLFRCTVTGDSASAWEDVTDETDYEGWDNQWPSDSSTDDIHSSLVTDIIISPSWTLDKTVLVTTVSVSNLTTYVGVYMQCGSWGTSPGWNAKSSLGIDAVEIKTDDIADINLPLGLATFDARGIAGLLLPEDYNSKNTDDRVLWVWVNYWDSSPKPMCDIMRVEDDSDDPVGPMGQIEDGEVWLTNISYHGTIAEGEAMAGVLGKGGYDPRGSVTDLFEDCCEGVQVYRNNGIVNMDICCERWHDACKPPTGVAAMAVTYVGDDKAYAVALLGVPPYEEGAWSVTFDDGDTWNQLSLIDTDVDYLSDVAVSPDCNKTFLVSVNYDDKDGGYCHCDSVWLHAEDLPEAEEYSGQWLRTWCGLLEGDNSGDFPWVGERGLLRLNPEETTGDTVFLVDRQSGNVYMNDLETLACWDPISSTAINHIVDLVAQDADTLFALDASGEVSMFDDDEWQEAVEGEVDYGWTIAVHGDHVLVGGQDGDVSYSDDGGETFTELEKVVDVSGAHVTVAFDSYFDQNDTIYAALANAFEDNGIYLWVIGESEDWFQTNAAPMNYTGLVLDRPSPGNPYTSPDTGGVLYASFYAWWPEDNANCDCCSCPDYDDDYGVCDCWYSGVARCLTPITELCCGVGEAQWDYLTWGLVPWGETTPPYPTEFTMPPQALKICGCLTADSNSKLFAIDDDDYAMCDGQDGAVWTFEDCYAKKAVELESPAEGLVVPADPCSCENVPFTIRWDRLCDACCYEIQFALDEDFTELVTIDMEYMLGTMIDDMVDEYYYGYHCYCPDAPMTPSAWIGSWFTCEFTYYWRVRASQAETCQEIHSWWSEPRSFTVAPSAAAAKIDLVSPVPGATGVATKNVGFSWDLTATADKFDWVLDDNADLSSPIQTKTGLTSRACTYTGTLTHGTTYYWQVTAYNEGAPISVSAVGTFTTAAQGAFCCPQCGLCFDTQAELQAHIDAEHPAQPATPFWVWVIIVIGAVLVIVVIVLIFRTRRV